MHDSVKRAVYGREKEKDIKKERQQIRVKVGGNLTEFSIEAY